MTHERRVGMVAAGVGLVVAGLLLLSPIRGSRGGAPSGADASFRVAQALGLLETAQRAHFRFKGGYTSDLEVAWQFVPAYNRPNAEDVVIEIVAADSAGWQAVAVSRPQGILCARAGGAGPSAVLDTSRLDELARREGVSFFPDCAGSGDLAVWIPGPADSLTGR